MAGTGGDDEDKVAEDVAEDDAEVAEDDEAVAVEIAMAASASPSPEVRSYTYKNSSEGSQSLAELRGNVLTISSWSGQPKPMLAYSLPLLFIMEYN